jgi:hypothetical protein
MRGILLSGIASAVTEIGVEELISNVPSDEIIPDSAVVTVLSTKSMSQIVVPLDGVNSLVVTSL